jgi:hypothetical protein
MVKEDFAALEFVIEVIDRRHVALRRVIGNPLAFFILPAVVGMAAVVSAYAQHGQKHCLGVKRIDELQLSCDIAQAVF